MRTSRRIAPRRVEFRPFAQATEGVLFTHELVGTLLPFSGKALMGSAVGAIKDGEEGRGKRSICTSLKARPVAALTELL